MDYADYDDFFRVEFPRTVRYLRRAGAAFEEAEDAAQEAMQALWPTWPTCEHPVGWVRTTALRAYVRKAERDRKRVALEAKNARLATPAPPPSAEPDEYGELVRPLRELPLRQREVLALGLDGYGTDEIAELLDLKSVHRPQQPSPCPAARDALEATWNFCPRPAPRGPPSQPPSAPPSTPRPTRPETHSQEGGPHVQQG